MIMDSKTLDKIIQTATLVCTCAYKIYALWKEDVKQLKK